MPTTIVADLRINTAGAYRDIDIFKSKLNRGISQPLGRISGDAAEFSKSLQAAAARVTAFGAITGGILAVNKAISAAARSTIEVNKQLVELNTFLGESQQNLDRFGKSLFNIARATATNFSDVAEAAKEFARQGLSTEETLKRTNDALVLSRVSGLNYAQSVNSITTAINGFNKEALSSTEIISKLIAVDSRFAVSAAQLSEALTRVGSSAEESGLSFDELVATITTAQQITGRGGAVIGNALKTIFTRVRRPEILDQLRQLGVVIEDQNGVLLNGIQILKNYSEATKNLSQAEKSRTAELLGGVYQINQLQAVIRDLSSANSIYSNSLKISVSATDEAIKKNEQLNKSYSALISQTTATATQVGSDLGKNLFGPLITGGTSAIQTALKLLSPEKFEEAGINAGQAMAKGAGQEIVKGLSSAFGNFLLYTGGPVLATIGAGLGLRLVKFLGASFKTQAKEITDPLGRLITGGSYSGKAEKESLALQTQISGVMQRISGLTKDTASSAYNEARAKRQVLQEIKRINLELQRQVSLSRSVASDLMGRGYSDIFEVPPARPPRRRRRAASGYVPNFADPILMEEEQQARSKSAKNPKAYYTQATIKGKKQVIAVNDQEEIIPNFAGTGDTAIIPRYRKMQDIPRMGSGYVPNFAQKISSAGTSINQVPALFKKFGKQLGPRNIDIGGGKYDTGTIFLNKTFGISSRVYDPFNRTKDFNDETLKQFFGTADSATIANVLNVIKEGSAREDLLKFISKSIKPKGSAYFGIYEGNKSGVGAVTSKGYQRNLPADKYLEEISKYFDIKRKTGNYIIGSPLASGYIPNFAKSKFVQNIVDSYKASLTEKDPIRFNAAQKHENYYSNVNAELKNLSASSGISLEKLAYGLAALSGNTADSAARKGIQRIASNKPYNDLVLLPENIEKVKKMIASSGSTEELMSILGKGAKTQNFAQSLLLSENFSGFGKYKNPLGTPSVMDSWAIYVRNGGALKEKYDKRLVSAQQKSKVFGQSAKGYKYYNKLVKEYGEAAKILGVPVRQLQARTWAWARTQIGSRTRNDSFASGYIPNFAKDLDYNPNFLVGSGSDAIFLSAYDQLVGEFGGGPAYPEVTPGRSFATTSTGSLNTLNQNAMSIINKGGRAFFSPVVNNNALESLGGNKFFLMALAKRYPRFSNFKLAREILNSPAGTFKISEIRNATNKIISNIQKNYGRNKGVIRAREVAESIADKRFLNPQYKNLSTSLITEIVSDQGSIIAPTSRHSLYNLAALGGGSKMSNPIQYQKIFEGLIDKDRLSGLRNSYIPIGRRFNLGDDFSKMLGLASGFIPNYSGLSDAIGREKTMSGLPVSQIMAHFDRKGNPIAVTNKKDEPNGLRDVVPNFARPSLPRDARGRFTRRTIEAAPTSESASKDLLQFIVQTIGLGGVSALINELYSQEIIDPETNKALQIAIPILGGLSGARRGLKQSKGQSFGRRAASFGVPLALGAAGAGYNLFASGQITQDIQRRKLDKEIDASAREFKSVTEGTQELVDTLSKLDAAFKDSSTAPEQLIKLSKKESELLRSLSATNPGLSSRLASEPNLEKRIEIIEDVRREASRRQAAREEITAFKGPDVKKPEDLNKFFSRQVATASEALFKFTEADLKPENFEKITKAAKLEPLLEFFNTLDQTTKDKLIPIFFKSVDSEIKFFQANQETNKTISKIRGEEIKKRTEIDRARELRSTRTQALGEGLSDLSNFASQFGPRAAISFGVEADKMKKSLEVSSAFRNLINLKTTDKELGLPRNISESLSKIERPSAETTNLIREMAKDQNLNERQKDSLEELAVNSERQTKQLEQISKIGEINKEVQLKVLKIQEKLSFGGGIKTSTDAASRIASINAPLTGALQYRLGSMLGSERSQVSGLTNLLKSIQDKYPGMIDKSVDLKSVTDRLVALRTRDLQKDLLRDAGVLQSVGLGGTSNILRTKAADTLSLRNIAETQVGAELQTGENPAEAIRYFGDVVRDSLDSLGTKFAEERTIRQLESENLPKVEAETRKNEEFRAGLQKSITDAIRGSLGDSFKFNNGKIDAYNSTVVINEIKDFFGLGNSQKANPTTAEQATKSGGFIPSFYDPLREAISRESQYVPFNSIRVNQSEKLISSRNPMGLAVTNTIDEPNGLASIGLASKGFVPNFANEQEDIYEPGTAKIPLISKTVGRFVTNLTTPVSYDLEGKVKDIGETGPLGVLKSVVFDEPSDTLKKGYNKKLFGATESKAEAREPLYRWMYGLDPQTDWQKYYIKNPDNSVSFNRNTAEGKALFDRAILNAVQAKLQYNATKGKEGASASRHPVMSNYGYTFEDGKLKFFDRWDFDTHQGEEGLFDFFKPGKTEVPSSIGPGSAYAKSNSIDTTSGSFGARLKNTVRGAMSSVTAPVTIRGEIPISDLSKFLNQAKTQYRYKDQKTGKFVNQYPFLESGNVMGKLGVQNNSLASKSSGFIPNFAAFGRNVAQQAIENARAGKLYVWDNIDNIYRKVRPDGNVELEGISENDLPKNAKVISTAIAKGDPQAKQNILNLKDPKVSKLDELKLPGIARSEPIDKIISKLNKQKKLTPKNLLNEINRISGGREVLVKTAFGGSNFQSKGLYGLKGALTTSDTSSIIGKFKRGTGSGFFIQNKVPTYYNELRVHVAVDESGRVKIIKGGTILKATGFDPTSQPSIEAYRKAGLSRREAIKMTRSFKKTAEATAVENIINLVKSKNIRNAFFGVDVGGTTLEAAIEAGVKPREFYSGGRGRVSTIVYEVNPTNFEGSSGFVGRGVVPKLVKSIFGQKPEGVVPPESPALGITRFSSPRLPTTESTSAITPTATGTPKINIKESSVLNSLKDTALRIKNSKLGGKISGLSGKVAQGASSLLSGSARNIIGRASGASGKVMKSLVALGGLGAIGESIGEFKEKNYGLAALKAGEGSLLLASLSQKGMGLGGKALPGAAFLGLASEIALSKNNQVAEDFSDIFLGRKSVNPVTGEKYRSGLDIASGVAELGFDALMAGNPFGQSYLAFKYGYRTGNVLEEKLGIGNKLGESFLYAGSTMAERARRAKQSDLGEGISKQDVIEGKVSLEAYLAYKRKLLEEKEAGLGNMSRGFIPNFAKGQLTIDEQLEQDKLEIEEQKRKRAEQEEVAKQERIKQAEISAAAAAQREEQRKTERARQDEQNELRQQESDTRSKLVEGVIKNEETNQLFTSRDKANYLISQERIFGTFTRENFKGNEDLYDSYQAFKKEKENQAEAERRLMKPKESDFYVEGVTKPELLNKRKAQFTRAQETAEATRDFRERAAKEAEALGGATAAQRQEAYNKGIALEKVIPETQRPANFVRAGLGLPPLPSVDKNIINPQTYGEVINGRFYTKDQIKEAYDKGVSVESIKFGNRRMGMPKLPTQQRAKKTKSSFGLDAQFMASISDLGLNMGIFVEGVYYTQSEIAEARKFRISPAELRRKKKGNKSSGFVPNFNVSTAFAREKLDILNNPDYSGYRNAAPQPSKYYKNVVKNSAEIEVPAVEVYNRMGLFGAKPKNSNEQYAILNPAQQAQLGYASKGFVPNFAPEQFAGAVGEAMQKALAPYFEKAGSSVTNSNVININDQRTIQTTSDKVYAVMEFLQDQFPTQFARKMGPQSV